jgi:hypothetical protein
VFLPGSIPLFAIWNVFFIITSYKLLKGSNGARIGVMVASGITILASVVQFETGDTYDGVINLVVPLLVIYYTNTRAVKEFCNPSLNPVAPLQTS